MSFTDTEMTAELRSLTRKFAENEIRPHVEHDEETGTFRPEIIAKLGEIGLTGVAVPEAYGGAGLGYQEYAAVVEELARVHCAYAISVAVTGLPQQIVLAGGTEEQKKKVVPLLASGKGIGAFGLSEASSGSDAGSLRTTAKRVGPDGGTPTGGDTDHYVINGTKLWITQADVADFVLLMARTGDQASGTKGVSAFIVEKGTPGFRMGKREKKMGMHASHTMEIVFENARIPVANRIGEEGQGFKVAMNALNSGRITIAATAVGVARGALETAIAHAKSREQFGKPIADFQGVSFMLADMKTHIEASDLLVRRAAWLKDQGLPFGTEASMAKLFATDTAMKVTTDAVQILGGSGYTQEFPAERYMREAKMLQIVEGTNQIQRLVISRSLA